LGTPPAFVLSQDQTLQRKLIGFCFGPCGPPLFVALRFVQFSRNDQSLHRQKNYFLKSDYYNVSSFRFFVNTLFLFFLPHRSGFINIASPF
ncbi:hypothetical protein, partial [Geobacillus stearothermophilus]|uniref:hypothetical protein n=1 Tax=Geobacillus stearothermophilus TaxID=1422 RepID=UPI002E24C108|nr:hypothetical protein [Geobacillus stearothermophilus]